MDEPSYLNFEDSYCDMFQSKANRPGIREAQTWIEVWQNTDKQSTSKSSDFLYSHK